MTAIARRDFADARRSRRAGALDSRAARRSDRGARRGAAGRLRRARHSVFFARVRCGDRLVAGRRHAGRRTARARRLAALQRQLVREALLQNGAAAGAFVPLADTRLDADQELAAANGRVATCRCRPTSSCSAWATTATQRPGSPPPTDCRGDGRRGAHAGRADPRAGAPEPRLTMTGRCCSARGRSRCKSRGRQTRDARQGARRGPGRGDADPRRAARRGGPADDLRRGGSSSAGARSIEMPEPRPDFGDQGAPLAQHPDRQADLVGHGEAVSSVRPRAHRHSRRRSARLGVQRDRHHTLSARPFPHEIRVVGA